PRICASAAFIVASSAAHPVWSRRCKGLDGLNGVVRLTSAKDLLIVVPYADLGNLEVPLDANKRIGREPPVLTKKLAISPKAFASSSRLTICMWHESEN